MVVAAPAALEELARATFVAVGTPEDIAAHVARHLIRANLSGHDSHGILRVPSYVQYIERGQLDPAARPAVIHERGATAVVDGARGFGHVAASFAMELALRKAAEFGASCVAGRRFGHIGRLGEYPEFAANRGFVAVVMVGGAGRGAGHMAPFGGRERRLGTNPWAIGIPVAGRPPFLADFATTAVAEGKLRVARAKHAPLPPGVIADAEGRPTTNVEDFYSGGFLLPAGGHKGYALSMVAALLGAGLSGRAGERAGGGVTLLAVNPALFHPAGGGEAFAAATAALVDVIKDTPPAAGFDEVLVPGEPEERSRAERSRQGIAVPLDTWRDLESVASRLGVPMPQATER